MDKVISPETGTSVDSVLNSQAQVIVKNVLHNCKSEKNIHPHDYIGRASFYTGIPRAYLENIDNSFTPSTSPISLFLELKIHKVLLSLCAQGEKPQSKLLYDKIMTEVDWNISLLQFQKILVECGYVSVKLKNGSCIIMENPKLRFERFHYLNKIRIARSMDNQIYYFAIKAFEKSSKRMVTFSPEFQKTLNSKDDILLFYHLVSRDGFENGFFSYSYEPETLIKLVLHVFQQTLKPSSLIIIENNPLYGSSHEKYITRFHKKKEMIKWLKAHNIPCNTDMYKAELFNLIEKCSIKLENNSLDNVLKSLGHEVLRLPEQLQQLSLTERLWQDINENLYTDLKGLHPNIQSISPIAMVVKDYLSDKMSSIDSTVWLEFDEIIKTAEEELFQVDTEMDKIVEEYDVDYTTIVDDADKQWHHITMQQ